jgi:hypothetical protein
MPTKNTRTTRRCERRGASSRGRDSPLTRAEHIRDRFAEKCRRVARGADGRRVVGDGRPERRDGLTVNPKTLVRLGAFAGSSRPVRAASQRTSLGSHQTLRCPHRSTLAASRFWSLRLTMLLAHGEEGVKGPDAVYFLGRERGYSRSPSSELSSQVRLSTDRLAFFTGYLRRFI